MNELLRIFRAVADSTRLRILRMLDVKPLCVCEVMDVLDMAQSTASKHLRILADAGLIEATPGGVWTVYRLSQKAGKAARAVIDLVCSATPTLEMQRDGKMAKGVDRSRICRRKLFRQTGGHHA